GGQPHAHPVADACGNLDADVAARPHASVAATPEAGIQDDFADAPAGGARSRRHHLAQQRALHALDFASPAAGVARHRAAVIVRAFTLAFVTQLIGVDGAPLGHAGRAV